MAWTEETTAIPAIEGNPALVANPMPPPTTVMKKPMSRLAFVIVRLPVSSVAQLACPRKIQISSHTRTNPRPTSAYFENLSDGVVPTRLYKAY